VRNIVFDKGSLIPLRKFEGQEIIMRVPEDWLSFLQSGIDLVSW
jgi:hypothetical protein